MRLRASGELPAVWHPDEAPGAILGVVVIVAWHSKHPNILDLQEVRIVACAREWHKRLDQSVRENKKLEL